MSNIFNLLDEDSDEEDDTPRQPMQAVTLPASTARPNKAPRKNRSDGGDDRRGGGGGRGYSGGRGR